MEYSGGTMMSNADNHTMDVTLAANDNTASYIDNITTSYILAQYETPHIVTGNKSGEYINVLKTSGSNCGKILSAIMTSEADFADMFLFDASVNFVPSKYTSSEIFVDKDEFINTSVGATPYISSLPIPLIRSRLSLSVTAGLAVLTALQDVTMRRAGS